MNLMVQEMPTNMLIKFAKELLEVADNLQRAQEAVAADALKAGGTLKSLHDGVGMTCKTLQKVEENFKKIDARIVKIASNSHIFHRIAQLLRHQVFKAYGIEEFNPDGEIFDPNKHEAMLKKIQIRARKTKN